MCIDYRDLNSSTESTVRILPNIETILESAAGHSLYTKIDLKGAFNLLRIKEGDEWLTTFVSKFGAFQYNVIPFGLKNAPGHFQYVMDQILGGLYHLGVICYIDDILVYCSDVEEHRRIVQMVFDQLRKYNLIVSLDKCEFEAESVDFLGHHLSKDGIQMLSRNLDAIKMLSIPSNLHEVQSFLGLTNYYRAFIPDYAAKTLPLTRLLKKDAVFEMTEEIRDAVADLKSSFIKNITLATPDRSRPFILQTDASDFTVGGALHQWDDKKEALQPLGFFSRKFTPAELNYPIYDKEFLAIKEGLEHWRHLLIDTIHPVECHCDHKNLSYFRSSQKLNRRQARWLDFLADYNIQICYVKGTAMYVADPLSRDARFKLSDADAATTEQTLLPESRFTSPSTASSLRASKLILAGMDQVPMNALITLTTDSDDDENDSGSDFDFTRSADDVSFSETDVGAIDDDDMAMEQLWDSEQITTPDPQWFQYLLSFLIHDYLPLVLSPRMLGFLNRKKRKFTFKGDRLHYLTTLHHHNISIPYVPISYRNDLLKKYHQTLGHLAAHSLFPLMSQRYYWPTLERDIITFISNCNRCQLNEPYIDAPRRPLHPHEPVGLPFLKWGIDFVQGLQETPRGNRHIITAVDYATKFVVAKAVVDRTASTVASFIFHEITCRFGTPVEIVTDRASAFLDSVLQEYLKVLEIHHLATTPYTPRTNGVVERMHRPLKDIITKLSAGERNQWDFYLSQAVFALNARISDATGFSPFYLSHVFEPRMPGDVLPILPPHAFDLNDEIDAASYSERELLRLGQNRAAALQRLKAQSISMKRRYDSNLISTFTKFSIGDLVKMKNHSQMKYQFRWTGPYYVVDLGPNDTYYLMKPNGSRIDSLVNHDFLAPYTPGDDEFYYDGSHLHEI